jgi:hypothetical protein
MIIHKLIRWYGNHPIKTMLITEIFLVMGITSRFIGLKPLYFPIIMISWVSLVLQIFGLIRVIKITTRHQKWLIRKIDRLQAKLDAMIFDAIYRN